MISRIGVAGVAVCVFITLLAFAILLGFKRNIKQNIFSFGGHIQLSAYDADYSLREQPITLSKPFIDKCKSHPQITSMYPYATKGGLVKTENEVNGIVIKGINADFNPDFLQKNLVEGRYLQFYDSSDSKEVLMSRLLANKLQVQLNDYITVYFLQNPPRVRKMQIVGLFETGMEEFDENFLLGDIKLLKKINGWREDMVGGYEIRIKDFDQLDPVADFVFEYMDYDLGLEKVTDKYVTVFDWLSLLDQNVAIFLTLITLVAAFNIVSCLLIMIMERAPMIGSLKAFGATNSQVLWIFFFRGLDLVIKGLLIGNILGALFCYVQAVYKIIPLDPQNYYMDTVPIEWNWLICIAINAFALIIFSGCLFIPALLILKIKPIKSIRFQ